MCVFKLFRKAAVAERNFRIRLPQLKYEDLPTSHTLEIHIGTEQ